MKAKSRRQAREAILRALYEIDLGHTVPLTAIKQAIWPFDLTPEHREWAVDVVEGIYNSHERIQDLVESVLERYNFERLAAVDRNVLRMAVYELLYCDDIPPLVSISEAVAIAKKYSTAESGRFVNGVLARVLPRTPKRDWTAPENDTPYEEASPEPEPEPVIEEVAEGSPEEAELKRVGAWRIRTE